MANKTITDYSAANSIDAVNDYLLIEQSSVYRKINRNTILGLSSAPLGTTDSQSPQNKTYDNTNSYTTKDGSFTLQNSSSITKQAVFSLASITAGQTRTITVPDANLTLVGTATTQTLTSKTLTSPTISGGSIDNATITVDSISGHTSGTVVTVANLQINNGVLNSANAVTATSIAAGAVQPQALVTGTGSGWAWSSYTPTWTNLTIGNATQTARFIQIGKTVFFSISVVLGSTSSVGTAPTYTLPVTAQSSATIVLGVVEIENTGVANYTGATRKGSTTTGTLDVLGTNTYASFTAVTASVPFSWANGSKFNIQGMYEAA